MASPRLALAALVVMLAVITLSEGLRGVGPKKCCFQFTESPVPKGRVVGYSRTSQRCSNSAYLLHTSKGRQLCVRPSAPWVKELVRYLDSTKVAEQSSSQ